MQPSGRSLSVTEGERRDEVLNSPHVPFDDPRSVNFNAVICGLAWEVFVTASE
jgi:hypothetical protein